MFQSPPSSDRNSSYGESADLNLTFDQALNAMDSTPSRYHLIDQAIDDGDIATLRRRLDEAAQSQFTFYWFYRFWPFSGARNHMVQYALVVAIARNQQMLVVPLIDELGYEFSIWHWLSPSQGKHPALAWVFRSSSRLIDDNNLLAFLDFCQYASFYPGIDAFKKITALDERQCIDLVSTLTQPLPKDPVALAYYREDSTDWINYLQANLILGKPKVIAALLHILSLYSREMMFDQRLLELVKSMYTYQLSVQCWQLWFEYYLSVNGEAKRQAIIKLADNCHAWFSWLEPNLGFWQQLFVHCVPAFDDIEIKNKIGDTLVIPLKLFISNRKPDEIRKHFGNTDAGLLIEQLIILDMERCYGHGSLQPMILAVLLEIAAGLNHPFAVTSMLCILKRISKLHMLADERKEAFTAQVKAFLNAQYAIYAKQDKQVALRPIWQWFNADLKKSEVENVVAGFFGDTWQELSGGDFDACAPQPHDQDPSTVFSGSSSGLTCCACFFGASIQPVSVDAADRKPLDDELEEESGCWPCVT